MLYHIEWVDVSEKWFTINTIWKERFNSDGQQFRQYQLNQQSIIVLNHWTYERLRLLSILTHLRQHLITYSLITYSLNTISCMLLWNVLKLIMTTSALELIHQWQQDEEFDDTKEAIRISISKKNRQHNGQKKYKRTNNDRQNIHTKLKIE